MPNVSVIIPNYNREMFIGETIGNLLHQTEPPEEIIVVDDGSTDRSVEIVRSFGDKVILIQQPNQGPGGARNAGLERARCDYIQFQDSDDLLSLNKLAVQSRLMEATQADIVFGPWVKVRITDRTLKCKGHVIQQQMPPPDFPLTHWWLRGWFSLFPPLLLRRTFLHRVGTFRTDLLMCEDAEFLFRLLTSQPKCVFSPETLMLYRMHDHDRLTGKDRHKRSRQMEDWARLLLLLHERIDAVQLNLDRRTRSLLLSKMNATLRYRRRFHPSRPGIEAALRIRVRGMSRLWLFILEIRSYRQAFFRFLFRGTFLIPAYRPGNPTVIQRQLIAELGYRID